MKVTSEKLPQSRMLLTIEVEGNELEQSLKKTYRSLSQRVKVPGFRPGKAPRSVIQSFVGKDAVINETLQDLAPELVQKAIEQESLEAIDTPDVQVETQDPVVIKATVPLSPVVELGNYKSIRVAPDPVEVKPEQVEEAIESVRMRNAPWEQVERPVEFGDLLTLDVDGSVNGKSVVSEKGASFQPNPETSYPVPGFSEKLTGMARGDTQEFSLTMPDSFGDPDIAGKECSFTVTVQSVKAKAPAPLDDDFVKGLDEEYETVDEFRSKIEEALTEHAKNVAERKFETDLLAALKGGSTIEAPPSLTEREVDHMLVDEARALARSGIELESYMKATGKTPEDLRAERRESAEDRVTTSLLLSRLAEVEEIEASDSEVDDEIKMLEEQQANADPETLERLHSDEVRSNIENRLKLQKALERMKEIALQGPELVVATPGAASQITT